MAVAALARQRAATCPRHAPSASASTSPSPTMSQLGWEAAASGFINLASEVDVAVCRLHYYLQRMHGIKAQVESLWQPTRLRMSSLEASFRADVESYLVGVRQDAARLESAQLALRRLLSSDSSPATASASGCASSAGESPRKPAAAMRRGSLSLSPRQPALTTLKEESSRSDSDQSRKEDFKSRSKKKQRKRSDKNGSDTALLTAELEKLRDAQRGEGEELDTTATAAGSDSSARPAGAAAAGSGASESSSVDGGPGCESPTSDESGGRTKSSEDLSILRVDLVTPRSVLEEIREHQAALYAHLQLHSQRMLLVAATRRRFSSGGGGFRRRRSPPALGQAFEDPRALQLAVEAAIRELLSAREPLLSRAEELRRLAAAVDEARPPPQPQQLRDLSSLRMQPMPELPGARRSSCLVRLRRVLRSWECHDFWANLCDFLSSFCFCCCAFRPSFVERQQPVYESTWLMRSPPRGYSTTRL